MSGMAIGGRQREQKGPKKARNGPFVTISRPGASKLVVQGWINLGYTHDDVLGQFPGSRMAIRGRHMDHDGHSES